MGRMPTGEWAPLHSLNDPLQEAERLISHHDFLGEDITILMGFGLGYLPLAILKRMHPEHFLVIVEACPEIILNACRTMDLSPVFANKRVHIFTADQIKPIWELLEKEQLKLLAGRVNKLIHPPSRLQFPDAYHIVENKVEAFVTMQEESFKALEAQRNLTAENVLKNMVSILHASAADLLFKSLKGYPALVIAAGPSLDKNISNIRTFKDRALLIAVDTALKPLAAEGITPDMVVSVDPSAANLKKITSIPRASLDQIPLIFSPHVRHEIPSHFHGPKFVFGMPNSLIRWALSHLGEVKELPYGFSVAHYAFYLAREMEADPIIFVGLDLAFTHYRAHAKNCSNIWSADLKRPDIVFVPGIEGVAVPSFPGFAKMITLFEKEIKNTKARCIDATEGGAFIEGTSVMTLEDARELCAYNNIPLTQRQIREIWHKHRLADCRHIKSGLKWLLDEADDLYQLSQRAMKLLSPVLKLLDQKAPLETDASRIFEEINEISDQVNLHRTFLNVIRDQMGKVFIEQYKLKFQLEREIEEAERLRLGVYKSHIFFERLIQIVDKIRCFGTAAIRQLETTLETKDISLS